jgi:hypothetical protein
MSNTSSKLLADIQSIRSGRKYRGVLSIRPKGKLEKLVKDAINKGATPSEILTAWGRNYYGISDEDDDKEK